MSLYKDPSTQQPKEEPLLETRNIGSDEFKNKINRVVNLTYPQFTGIIYYAGHGGKGIVIAIPSNPTTVELFGDGEVVVTATSSLNDLSKVRLVYMDACETCSDANGTGLVASIASKGAWAVVGFHVKLQSYLQNPPGRKADLVFFRTLAGSKGGLFGRGKFEGKTVKEALEAAYSYVNSKKYKQWQDCYGVAGSSPLIVTLR